MPAPSFFHRLVPPFFALTGLLAAQDRAEESFIPNFSIGGASFTEVTDADAKGSRPGSVSQREAQGGVQAPLFFGEDLRLTAGFDYRWTQFDFTGAPLPLIGSDTLDLHRVDLPVNLWIDLNERWKFWGRLQPGWQSDFGTMDGEDFILTSLALASYRWSEHLTLAFGGFYSRDLGEERLLPALGVILRSDPHWSLALTFPRVELAYAPEADWLFTGRAVFTGGGWNITDPAGGPDLDFYHRALRAGLGAEHRIAGPVWIHADAGVQVAQEIEVQGPAGEFATELDPAAFFSLGVRLRF